MRYSIINKRIHLSILVLIIVWIAACISAGDGNSVKLSVESVQYSPDDKFFIFDVSWMEDDERVLAALVYSRDTNELKRLIPDGKGSSNVSFSNDGKKIAFNRKINGFYQVFYMDMETSTVIQLTKKEIKSEYYRSPFWGGNNKKIFYIKSKIISKYIVIDEIWSMNIDSKEETIIAHDYISIDNPQITYNDTYIIFSSMKKKSGFPPRRQLVRIEIETGKELILFDDLKRVSATLAKNRKSIILFMDLDNRESGIFEIDINGKNLNYLFDTGISPKGLSHDNKKIVTLEGNAIYEKLLDTGDYYEVEIDRNRIIDTVLDNDLVGIQDIPK